MAKSTDAFKRKIKKELDLRAFKNTMFEEKYNNPDKNIDACIDYIIAEVQASGNNGFEDEEVYGMAIHYYSEKEIKTPKKASNARVVVNHSVNLTAEEIAEAKQDAKDKVIQEEMDKLRGKDKKPKVTKGKTDDTIPNTLF